MYALIFSYPLEMFFCFYELFFFLFIAWLMDVWHLITSFLCCILVAFLISGLSWQNNLDLNDATWLSKLTNWALFSFPGTVMNTCPARRTSTGRPGRHGNAAPYLVAEASSHDEESVRTATTVRGVVRYVTQKTKALTCTIHLYVLLSCLFIV